MTKSKLHAVSGIFKGRNEIDRCISSLVEAGVANTRIFISASNPNITANENFLRLDKKTTAPESSITGAAICAVVLGAVGGLMGSPSFDFALVGTAAGLFFGAIIGGLIGRKMKELDPEGYQRKLSADEFVLRVSEVEADFRDEVETIMKSAGGILLTADAPVKAPHDVHKLPDNNDDNEFATGFKSYAAESKVQPPLEKSRGQETSP